MARVGPQRHKEKCLSQHTSISEARTFYTFLVSSLPSCNTFCFYIRNHGDPRHGNTIALPVTEEMLVKTLPEVK